MQAVFAAESIRKKRRDRKPPALDGSDREGGTSAGASAGMPSFLQSPEATAAGSEVEELPEVGAKESLQPPEALRNGRRAEEEVQGLGLPAANGTRKNAATPVAERSSIIAARPPVRDNRKHESDSKAGIANEHPVGPVPGIPGTLDASTPVPTARAQPPGASAIEKKSVVASRAPGATPGVNAPERDAAQIPGASVLPPVPLPHTAPPAAAQAILAMPAPTSSGALGAVIPAKAEVVAETKATTADQSKAAIKAGGKTAEKSGVKPATPAGARTVAAVPTRGAAGAHAAVSVGVGAFGASDLEAEIASASAGRGETAETDNAIAPAPVESLMAAPSPPRFEASLELSQERLQHTAHGAGAKTNDETRAAITFALGQYAQGARLAKDLHERIVGLGNSAEQSTRQIYEDQMAKTVEAAARLNRQIEQETTSKLSELDLGAQAAERVISDHFEAASADLCKTVGGGYGRLHANAAAACAQKPAVLQKIEAKRAKPFDESAKRYQKEADEGTKALDAWPKALEGETPIDGGGAQDGARNEAKRKQAARLLPHKKAKLDTLIKAAIAGEAQRKADDWKTEGPKYSQKIDERQQSIVKDGGAAISGALHQAQRALDEQAQQARQTIAQMHAAGRSQILAQRTAARARATQQANSTLQALHGEAQAAVRSLSGTLAASLPAFARTTERLGDSLARAAESGPAALNNAARSAPNDVGRAARQAHLLQTERLGQMQRGIEQSFEHRVTGFESAANMQVAAAMGSMGTTVISLVEQFAVAAETSTRGFDGMTGSIAHAADRWLDPLEKAFKQDIEDTQQKGDPKRGAAPAAGEQPKAAPSDVEALMRFAPVVQKPSEGFKTVLDSAAASIINNLNDRSGKLRRELNTGIFGPDVAAVLKPLHGLSHAQGRALESLYPGSLSSDLGNLAAADRLKAELYLQGNAKEAARLEVEESIGFFTDDEQRIKDVMRDLPPDAAKELANDPDWKKTAETVRDALSGADLDVFEARLAGETDKADALEMKQEIDEAREKDDKDALNATLEKYATARVEDVEGLDPEEREHMDAERRAKIQGEFAKLPGMAEQAAPDTAAADVLLTYATRTIVQPGGYGGEGAPPEPIELKVEGAQRDRAEALIKHGPNSVEAKTAALAVEIQRPGGADPAKLDKATVDPRLNPNNYPPDFQVPPAVAEAAKKDREAMLVRFAEKYGAPNQAASVEAAQKFVEAQLRASLANEKPYVQDVAVELLNTGHPTPAMAAKEMRYSIEGLGTNVPLIKTTLARMNRDEIAELRAAYKAQTGNDLYDDLGVFGHGVLGDLSGDDRVQVEVALQGVPRNAREKAEVAEFTRQQQLTETGLLGKTLAGGSAQEADLHKAGEDLKRLTGAELTFGPDGEPRWNPEKPKLFGEKGEYLGKNAEEFELAVQNAQIAAQNYAAKIDSYADAAVTAVAVLGAIAAAVATVATGGAASPFLLATIAGVTGAASMGMHRWISGGRYGWEQAAVDFGMTAVQMLTAGVGAQLGAASHGGMAAIKEAAAKGVALEMGKITGSAVMDMVLIGATTGGISGLGQAALSEEIWKKGFEHAFELMLEGTLRGMLSGAATAAASQALEHLPAGSAGMGKINLGGRMGQSTSLLGRSLMKAASSGVGAFTGRGVEIGFDVATGKFKGDAGDALVQMAAASAHAAVQGFGEGAGEAVGQRVHNAHEAAAAVARASKPGEAEAAAGVSRPVVVPEELTAPALPATATPAGLPAGAPPPGRLRTSAPEPTLEVKQRATTRLTGELNEPAPPFPVPRVPMESVEPTAPGRIGLAAEAPKPGADIPSTRRVAESEEGGGLGDGGGGGPRRPTGGGGDNDRLFPHLTDAEVSAAIDTAESRLMVRASIKQLGADVRPLGTPAEGEATLPQRQRAGALRDEADGLSAQATERLNRAIEREAAADLADSYNPRRAGALRQEADRLLNEAVDLESRAVTRRAEAEEFASGRRSATADLPGPENVDQMFRGLHSEAGALVRIPLSDVERNPALLQRLTRTLLEGERGGRMVFRVESERSRSLVHVDGAGNITVEGGAMVHLNFGSFERAVEFILNNTEGNVRLIAFEVDEAWVRAARSVAIPERQIPHEQGRVAPPLEDIPQLVDVRFADDQLGIPPGRRDSSTGELRPGLIEELNRFIIPSSGKVFEVPAVNPRPPTGGAPPGGEPPAVRVSVHDAEHHADAMRDSLLRHVPPDLHGEMANVPIRVASEADYHALTRSDSGPVVTMIRDGQPVILVREGTPIARLADEGPHLVQTRDVRTQERVARLDESVLRQWDHLDLDTQIGLYRDKIELEIDAHERIVRSIDEMEASGQADPRSLAVERERAQGTLRNLRARLEEVDGLGPRERAAIASGEQEGPQYLEQPARLFSKDLRPGAEGETPAPRTVFEPFAGPSLASARELQSRYPGAEVITSETSRPPSAGDIATFEQQGGRFMSERFGESLPRNSVDQMHVRFPLPHEKALEMAIDVQAELRAHPGRTILEIIQARQASIESITNLAPHALRALRPDGEMEIVFAERSIAREIEAATRLTWTDPVSGETYRFEVASQAAVVPRSVAPHSGFGIAEETHVNAITLRKVRVPAAGPEDSEFISSGGRRVVTEEERARGRKERAERRRQEREEKIQRRAEREQRAEAQRTRTREQEEAVRQRQESITQDADERGRALLEGRLTTDEDLQQRLSAVADELGLAIDDMVHAIRLFKEALGGAGRRYDAQDVIDSLRNRVREGRPPRFGNLEGLVSEIVVEQNAVAVQQMREHIAESRPDAVLGVERGGAFLAEALAHGMQDFPPTVPIAKHVEPREGQPDLVQRIPNLEREIRRRITEGGQSRFAIVDFYMGGIFAGELQRMFTSILREHPQAEFEVLWMREAHGFERVVVRPTRQDLEGGVAFTGVVTIVNGRLRIRRTSAGVALPPLKGTAENIPQVRASEFPVDVVLGDDMRAVLDSSPTEPVRIFDRDGRIVQEIPVGTPDPETGEPLPTTRDIMIRLMQGAKFDK